MDSATTESDETSVAPDGQAYRIPGADERHEHLAQIADEVERARENGRTIVAVQGLGFVGTAVCGAIASARDEADRASHLVVGIDLPAPETYWKVARLREGKPPIDGPDPDLVEAIETNSERNLFSTTDTDAYHLADVIVVDVPLGVSEESRPHPGEIELEKSPFEEAIRTIGRNMRADALVLVETTIPPGFTEHVIVPWLREERTKRGIEEAPYVAHAAERVMPGENYLASVKAFWRSFSGIDERSAEKARSFLSSFIDTKAYPLFQQEDPTASEMTKVLENAYRAANIAFIHEWTLLAEQSGVNLFDVVDAIRVREGTHDNMRYPGFGVGGYCLPKDGMLAQWSADELFDTHTNLPMTLDALQRNQRMPNHTFELINELVDESLSEETVAVCGVTYRPGVPDTRNSPAETLVDKLERTDATPIVHDPVVGTWPERPELEIERDLEAAIEASDGAVFTVAHQPYRELGGKRLASLLNAGSYVIDCFDIFTDEEARHLKAEGIRIAGVGKGHWRAEGFHR